MYKVRDAALATLSSKGQVTIPIKIRRILGINKQDKVEFRITHNDEVVLKSKKQNLSSSFGSVKKIDKTFDEQMRIAREEHLSKNKKLYLQ